MIRHIFIAIYILAVLLFAGFARAQHNPLIKDLSVKDLPVIDAYFNQKAAIIEIVAQRLTPCDQNVFPRLQYGDKLNVLELTVQAESSNQFCTQVIGNKVDLVYDLQQIEDDILQLGLNPQQEYILKVADTGLQIVISLDAHIMQQDLTADYESYFENDSEWIDRPELTFDPQPNQVRKWTSDWTTGTPAYP